LNVFIEAAKAAQLAC